MDPAEYVSGNLENILFSWELLDAFILIMSQSTHRHHLSCMIHFIIPYGLISLEILNRYVYTFCDQHDGV